MNNESIQIAVKIAKHPEPLELFQSIVYELLGQLKSEEEIEVVNNVFNQILSGSS